jgi:hypothetical protein
VRTASKQLHIFPYKISVVPLNLCIMRKEWGFVIGLCHVHDRLIDPKWTFFTDEANLNLLGYVNSKQQVLE